MVGRLALVLVALMARGASGQEVQGRETATSGQLIVLKANHTGEAFAWVYDREVYGDAMVCNETKTFAIVPNRPGRLVVWLVVYDTNGIETTSHAVDVLDGKPHSPPPPTPGDGGLGGFSAKLAAKYGKIASDLNDPPTAQAIVREWRAALGVVRGSPNLEAAGVALGDAWGRAMVTRQGKSRYVDWLNEFRKPLNADIDAAVQAGQIKTPEQLATVIEAVVAGIPTTNEGSKSD